MKNAPKPIVAYYRVSTKRQGQSGLGLDAQKASVKEFAQIRGVEVLREFTEIETGKWADRPQLELALAYTKRAGALLVVAKLDRLSRNLAFLAALMESRVKFAACDIPEASDLTVHILAAVAEWEAKAISERTKAALAQAKERGVLLGSSRPDHWKGREQARDAGAALGRSKAVQVISAKARAEYADILPRLLEMRGEGLSFAAIAQAINAEGNRTRRGCSFTPALIRKIILRGSDKPS